MKDYKDIKLSFNTLEEVELQDDELVIEDILWTRISSGAFPCRVLKIHPSLEGKIKVNDHVSFRSKAVNRLIFVEEDIARKKEQYYPYMYFLIILKFEDVFTCSDLLNIWINDLSDMIRTEDIKRYQKFCKDFPDYC